MVCLSSYEQWLIEMWHGAGTVGQNANGLTPLSWVEITSWANQFHTETLVEWLEHPASFDADGVLLPKNYTPITITRCTILDYELEWIHRLSCEYASEYSAASEPSRECPKLVAVEDLPEDQVLQNAENIAEGFAMLFSTQNDNTVEAIPDK